MTTKEEAIARLKACQEDGDQEMAHINADAVLCDLLRDLGYEEVVQAWADVDKWYA